MNIATRYHDTRLLLAIEQLKANDQLNAGSRDSGIARLQRTAATAEQQGLLFMSLDILIELGDLFVGSDSARAVGYYKHALEVTEKKKFNSYAEGISRKLFDFYSAKKDTALAFYYSQKVLAALIEKQDNDRKQGFDYIDYAVKDQDLAAARQRSDYNAKMFWLASIGCAMAIAIIFILWRNARLNRKTHLLLQNQYRSLVTAGESLQKSPEHSTITVSVSETSDQLTISVQDEGIGIPPAIAGQLFDPFTSAKRKGTAGEQTYGLGLYICKQIMEAHDGRIWFDNNTKDNGATFFIQLPVA